jgi:hypothetical protein
MLKLLFSKSGCVRCDDINNAGLYDGVEGLQELSLENAEGLSLAFFFEMSNVKGDLETPCMYIGEDVFGDSGAMRLIGDEVSGYLQSIVV